MDATTKSAPHSACLLCYRRKSKCVPSDGDESAGCEACRLAGVECIARLKNPLGRPKGSRKQSWRISRNPSLSTNAPAAPQYPPDVDHAEFAMSGAPASGDSFSDFTVNPTLDMSSTFLLDIGISAPQSLASSLGQDSQPNLLLHIFELHLELHAVSASDICSIEEQSNAVHTLEAFGQLIESHADSRPAAATASGGLVSPSVQWDLNDATLLSLFITALRAVAICPRLVSRLGHGACQTSPSASSEFPSPSELSSWQLSDDFALTGLDMDQLLASLAVENIDHAAFTREPHDDSVAGDDDRSRALVLTRLDMVLFNVGRFHRQFSRLLLGAKMGPSISGQMLAKFSTLNEQCLSTLRSLHSQIQAHLQSIPQAWQTGNTDEWRTLGFDDMR